MHIRKGLFSGDVEFFNGIEWKPLSKYKKGDKVLVWNENRTVELSTPIAYIKKKSPHINHVKSSMLDMCMSDNALFYGIAREETCGENTTKTMTLHRACLEDWNYFSDYRLVSTFEYINVTSSMMTEEKLILMVYTILFSKPKDNEYIMRLDNKILYEQMMKVFKKARVKYVGDNKKYTFIYKPPRNVELFKQSVLIFSKKEIETMINLIIETCGSNYIKPNDKKNLDFIQLIFALGGRRLYNDGQKLRLLVGKYTRLQSTSFKIEEKRVDKQYSFTVRSGWIVLKSKGLILVMADYVDR